jgi:hypothetical protein
MDVVRVVHEVGWVLSLGMHRKKRPDEGMNFGFQGFSGRLRRTC